MKSSVRTDDAKTAGADLTIVGVPEFKKTPPAAAKALDRVAGGVLGRAARGGDFLGKTDDTVVAYPSSGTSRIVFVGMGPDAVTAASLRRVAAIGARHAVSVGAASVAVTVPGAFRPDVRAFDYGKAVVEGVGQGSWYFDDLRSKPEYKRPVGRVVVLCGSDERREVNRGRQIGAAIADGHQLARDLQMLPGNHCPPSHLAEVARDLGKLHGFRVTVLGKKQMEKEGLRAHLAVAQGSAEEPRLITLEYKGAGAAAPVCLVGKGVTFDSGGISLKPGLNMEEMKYDMSGAAAVLGTFEAIGRIKPEINVVGVVPATENMPSGNAIKPGDVVTAHSGKTIEIINTDAEGRLILCDALSYARRFEPACMVDAATLTGAIVIGLGHQATGVMGNDDALIGALQTAGDAAGERCWPLPLWDVYRKQIKSTTADIKNVGGRPAGSITAGWFLREFVEDGTPWAHLDIAGTAWGDGDEAMAAGPTGVGVRLFAEFLLDRAG